MAVIVINGVPGVGKTTIAFKLASSLGIEQVIQTDVVKHMLQILQLPELSYCPSHQAWTFIGERTIKNIIKGFEGHTRYYHKWLLEMIKLAEEKGKNIIIEGVQATPEFFDSIPVKEKVGIFLTLSDKEEHRKRFMLKNSKRSITNKGWLDNHDIIRAINIYLLAQASKPREGFYVIENDSMEETIEKIIQSCSKLNLTRGICEAKQNAQRL